MASSVWVFLRLGAVAGAGGVSVVAGRLCRSRSAFVSWFLASARQKDVAGVGGWSWFCVFWHVVSVGLLNVGSGGWCGCVFGVVGLLFVPRCVRCGVLGEFAVRMFEGVVGVPVCSGF